MFERRRDTIDLAGSQPQTRCDFAPAVNHCPTSLAILRASASSSSKYPATSSARSNGGRPIIEVDRRGQDSRLDIDRYGIEVIGRRKPPAVRTAIEKAVVAKMIVGIGDQNTEHHASPELMHVAFRAAPYCRSAVHEFQVTACLVVAGPEHAHGRQERYADALRAIEAAQQQDRSTCNRFQAPWRHLDTRLLRQAQRNGLPTYSVDLVVLVGEFGNREMPALSLTDAFGRAPPSEEPGASNRRRSSSLSESPTTCSAADSSRGNSTKGGIGFPPSVARNGPPGSRANRNAPCRASSLTMSR